jgi:hypothetical protein
VFAAGVHLGFICRPVAWARELCQCCVYLHKNDMQLTHPLLPRQAVREKYERLLSAAPAAIVDCSSLFDGNKVIDVIENAVSKHSGRWFA